MFIFVRGVALNIYTGAFGTLNINGVDLNLAPNSRLPVPR
jgi:hypothetical protein